MSSLPLPSLDTTTASKLLPALQHATSGSVGTLISTCALYPLSLVVTRLQVQRQLQREGRAGREADPSSQSATARSTTRGDPTDPTSAAPAYAANATAAATASATANAAATRSSQQKHHQNHLHQQQQNSQNLKSSSSSSAPSDYDGIADAFSKIYATEGGVKALYTGLVSH